MASRRLPLLAAATVLPATALAQEPSPGFTLSASISSTNTQLYDESGTALHAWSSTALPGLAVYLNEDGSLVRSMHPAGFRGGAGAGGRVQEIAWDGTVEWTFDYYDSVVQQHHDIEPLPNGNVLLIAWEEKTFAEAVAAGRNPATITGSTFIPDHIVEVEPTGPTTGNVVWEWHVWDHLVQDFDPTKANFGVVADHPELIDVNYPPGASGFGDWTHANSVAYNAGYDQVVISAHGFDEIWVIDHSTTTAEAAGHTGGASGKGGDLLYRWGNPEAYGAGTSADRILGGQHDTNWVDPGYPGEGNLLVFNNDAGSGGPFGGSWSSVLEIVPPVDAGGNYSLTPGSAFGPTAPVWEYTAPTPTDFYSAFAGGGASRLPNGNTLITSPNQGWIFEVDAQKRIVWEKLGVGNVYKARRYERYLWTDGPDSVSVATGGSVDLDLVAGTEHASRFFLMLGSAGGTSPGLTVGGVHLPLNPFDAYFLLTLNPTGTPLTPSLGPLDALGKATSKFVLPAGLRPALAGLVVHHAYGVFDPVTGEIFLGSNAEPLALIP